MKSTIERRVEIANLVGMRGKLSVGELADYFNVSGATIRTDLRFLESMGHVVRSNGYVILNKGVIASFSAESRNRSNSKEMQVLISENSATQKKTDTSSIVDCCNGWEQRLTDLVGSLEQSIFIGAGSLTRLWAQAQTWSSGLILTDDIQLAIAPELLSSQMTIAMPGGIVDTRRMAFGGGKTEDSLKDYRVENAIVEVDYFIAEEGFFTANESDVRFLRTLRNIAKKLFIIVRFEKPSQLASFRIGDIYFADAYVHAPDND
ncbi:DeoR family transcriptional regulator [Citrobacter werkmanii]|uniref:DeoR family transcriptional regulator n=1 Tax=Citrobacter werkmanii TaxID=67827 RepID=UPI003463FB73